jgi:hypothetical protein
MDHCILFISSPAIAAINIIQGSCNYFIKIRESMEPAAISAVGMSLIDLIAITTTAPSRAPITAAVIPSTNVFTELFLAIFLNEGARIRVIKQQ